MNVSTFTDGIQSTVHTTDAQKDGGRVANLDQAIWTQLRNASSREAFVTSWLALQCRMISGVEYAVAVLGEPGKGPFEPVAFWPEGIDSAAELTDVAERAMTERRGIAAPVGSGSNGHRIAYPILVDDQVHGVVAVAVEGRGERQLRLVMRQLQWGISWIEVMLHRERATNFRDTRDRVVSALDMIAAALEHEHFRPSCAAVVTELATRLDCDRVSIGFITRNRARVVALSHAAEVGRQMDLIKAIAQAMDEAIDQETTILCPNPLPYSDIWVSQNHERLIKRHEAGSVLTTPLTIGDEVIGALLLEREVGREFDQRSVDMAEAIAAVIGPILEAQRRNDRWLIVKAGDSFVTQLKRLIGPGYFGRKLIIAATAAIVAFFSVFETTYRVNADATLEGKVRRVVVAPFDGYVAVASFRAGDTVAKNEVLAKLDDSDLMVELQHHLADQQQRRVEYDAALASGNRLELSLTEARLNQIAARIALVDEQLRLASLVAPFNGLVVSGDLSQSVGAAVERGQELFEIAPLDQYRIVLMVDESEIAEIVVGQSGSMIATAAPDLSLDFVVTKVTPVSEAREGHNQFRVEAMFAAEATEAARNKLRPGMEGVGKIDIGDHLLIWIWTHKLLDWARIFAWTWLP